MAKRWYPDAVDEVLESMDFDEHIKEQTADFKECRSWHDKRIMQGIAYKCDDGLQQFLDTRRVDRR